MKIVRGKYDVKFSMSFTMNFRKGDEISFNGIMEQFKNMEEFMVQNNEVWDNESLAKALDACNIETEVDEMV